MATLLELSPTARVIGISTLLDEAQAFLSTDDLAMLVLSVRRILDDVERGQIPAGTTAWSCVMRPELPDGARAYLRPIELLIFAAGSAPVLRRDQVWQVDAYLDEIVDRHIVVKQTVIAAA